MIKTNGKITENNCFGEKSGNIQTMSPTPLCTDLLGTLASYQRKPATVQVANLTKEIPITATAVTDYEQANPLDGSRWWAEADSPYQFLAFCKEASLCLHMALGNPEETFESSLPVAWDGHI